MVDKSVTGNIRWRQNMGLHGFPHHKRGKSVQNEERSSHSVKHPMSPPTKSKSNGDGQIIPEFINITNSFSLNSNSRSSVRAQAMRDYHRRRIQKRNGQHSVSPTASSIPVLLSAKEQTHRFRVEGSSRPRSYGGGANRNRKLAPRTEQNIQPQVDKNEQCFEWKLLDEIQVALRKSPAATDNPGYYSGTSPSSREGGPTESAYEVQFRKVEELLSNIQIFLKLSSLRRAVSPGVLDPFSAMSLLITPRTQLLLHHYFNIRLQTSWLMMPMRKGLFAIALHDEALFHTFMSHYVASFELRFGKGDPAESLQHRTEAIRIVNERLQDRTHALTDGTIATVANIAIYESTNGCMESMQVHLKGLGEMVRMRGGIRNGGFAPHVRRLLAWTDLHCATALSEKPLFRPLNFSNPNTAIDPTLSIDSHDIMESSTVYEDPELGQFPVGEYHLDWALIHIQDLSATLEVIRMSSILPKENVRYSDKVYYLQHCLLAIIHSPDYGQHDTVFATAALIFCCACFRDVNFNFRVVADGVKSLKYALETFEASHSFNGAENINRLFWTFALGGMAAEGKRERPWFVDKMKLMCGLLGLRSWDSARAILEGILWQSQLDQYGCRLWRDALK